MHKIDMIRPEEPKHLQCRVCLKEIPVTEIRSVEATDYVVHFCGLECYEKWKTKSEDEIELRY